MRAVRCQQRGWSARRLRAVLLLPTTCIVESESAPAVKSTPPRQWVGHSNVTFPFRTPCKQSPLTVSACRVCLETSRNCEHQRRPTRCQLDQPPDVMTVTAIPGILLPTVPLPVEWSSWMQLVTTLRPPCGEFWKPLPCRTDSERRFQFPCAYFVRQSMGLPEKFALTCKHTDRHNAGSAFQMALQEVWEALGCCLPGVKLFMITEAFFLLRAALTKDLSVSQTGVMLLLGVIVAVCSHLARKVMLSCQSPKDFFQANKDVSKLINGMLLTASVLLIATYVFVV
ncbi:MAG: uncharacterized protein KVP18_001162 [Porospora cf. gigantea A]|uniref:uncharacterized protein n=1 Tax=Porospora cf. gigantea A TaxID=2853593 RepID=UPI00355AB596|nr:MAG: hypothetical protein KVP18_001162 [Porospora cf. gigantea A]